MKNKNKRNIGKWIFGILFGLLGLLLVYLAITYHSSIDFYEKGDPGFSYVRGQIVYYYYGNVVDNNSIFPKKVQLRAYSDRDKSSSLIADAEIEITSTRIGIGAEEYASLYRDTFFIPPFERYIIIVYGEAPYGGEGVGERHGPRIEIINEEVYWEYWTEELPYEKVSD